MTVTTEQINTHFKALAFQKEHEDDGCLVCTSVKAFIGSEPWHVVDIESIVSVILGHFALALAVGYAVGQAQAQVEALEGIHAKES